ncbi:MAG TPA: lysoplasmalogenase [Holophagaceae bacterium]|nr:lysoplasmalogenase [Holophagaceae bacterium]
MTGPLIAGILLAAAASLHAVRAGAQPRRFYLLKPLTTALILGAAALAPATPQRIWMLSGLLLSLMGDICLMAPGEGAFLGGLGSFLLAHLAFIVAFSLGLPMGWPPAWTVLLGVYAAAMVALLWPRTGALRIPVLVYSLVLFGMVLAAARAQAHGLPGSVWALAGALTFVASDSLLAANRFLRPHPRAQVAILGTYWAALACLVRCLHG